MSAMDQAIAHTDLRVSDRDEAAPDLGNTAHAEQTESEEEAYELSRDERVPVSFHRLVRGLDRAIKSRERDAIATQRDEVAEKRDEAARARDECASELTAPPAASLKASLIEQFEKLLRHSAADRELAAADRAEAAMDRAEAALDRAEAARERERLEAELHSARLDSLTGAYRREMGPLAIAHEIDRVRRSDSSLVVAFVDVDGLKAINDHEGHAAGDIVLQVAVRHIRAHLRSYDPIIPIIRHGGDEFVCVLTDTTVEEAERRFASIGAAIEGEAGVGISVGFAALAPADTAERLINRADSAMLMVKRMRRSA